MSVRYALLALLRQGPMHGYQLKMAFEGSTGGTWPLNIGQVYTTLARLERDGCARPSTRPAARPTARPAASPTARPSDRTTADGDRAPADADRAQRPYEITDAGREDLDRWFATPVERTDRPRDELAIKLAIALATPGVDVSAVVLRQRTATMRALQEYTRLKAAADRPDDLSWRLVLDAMLFQAEAEIRWLDHCEASLVRHAPPPAPGVPPATRTEPAQEPREVRS
jgi:DNA-binding PadR family transcriptional regulator